MKAQLIYHGKYHYLNDSDHLDIITKDNNEFNSSPNIVGVIVKSITTGVPVVIEPAYQIPILEGESCPLEGFPPCSYIKVHTNEIPF